MSTVSMPIRFPTSSLDPDALAVTRRLQAAGHVTYFVGGCVRDLLLGRTPKDFDVATDARPEELKRVFGRRCRIIGRRFQLGHVHAGRSVIEVATFRGLPGAQETSEDDDSGFVVRANTFGPPEQDARSRDFTVNGMFYDPIAGEIFDWVCGREDVTKRLLRTIGDAEQRMREDPVRLLRAIKFASRLTFSIDEDIRSASQETAPLLSDCPAARVMEELFRIAESGYAEVAFTLMHELAVLDALLPEIVPAFADPEARVRTLRWLGRLDRLVRAHGGIPREAIYTLLAWFFLTRQVAVAADAGENWGKRAREASRAVAIRLAVPLRFRQRLEHTAGLMQRLLVPGKHLRPGRGHLRSKAMPLALTLLRLHFLETGEGAEAYERWSRDAQAVGIWAAPFEPRADEIADAAPRGRKRRRD